jgi:hypothetical protein
MALIRVMVGASDHRKWFREDWPASRLMAHFFGVDGSPVSVYEVTPGIEETKAVAGHYLTLARQHIEIVSALRIEPEDFDGLEMVIEGTPGDTGIGGVDVIHRDLIGDRVKFETMTQRLLDAIRRGEDRVRIVGELQLKHQLQEFLRLGNDGMNDRARRACRKLLGCGT